MEIRKFIKSDLTQLFRLISSGLLPDGKIEKIIEPIFTEENTIVLVIDQGFQEIVGCSYYIGTGDQFRIHKLFVKESERGNGFGRRLLEFTEGEIKSRSGKMIELYPLTQEDKDELIKRYEKWGYVCVDEHIVKAI